MSVGSTNSLLLFSFFKILIYFLNFLEDFCIWSTTLVTIFGGFDVQVDDPPNILLFLLIYFLIFNDLSSLGHSHS